MAFRLLDYDHPVFAFSLLAPLWWDEARFVNWKAGLMKLRLRRSRSASERSTIVSSSRAWAVFGSKNPEFAAAPPTLKPAMDPTCPAWVVPAAEPFVLYSVNSIDYKSIEFQLTLDFASIDPHGRSRRRQGSVGRLDPESSYRIDIFRRSP